MTHRLRLTVPADRHIQFDLPEEITGEVEIIVRPLVSASVTAEQAAKRAAIIRELQRTSPPQTSDSVDLIREDRDQ